MHVILVAAGTRLAVRRLKTVCGSAWGCLLIEFKRSLWRLVRLVLFAGALALPFIAEAATDSGQLEVRIGKKNYSLQNPEVGAPGRAAFEVMSEGDKTAFHINREKFISTLARSLQLIKFGIGVGVVSKDSLSYRLQSYRLKKILRKLPDNMSEGAKADVVAAQERALEELELKHGENTGVGFRERSERAIFRLLEVIDSNLWDQAQLFSHSNEFGVVLAVGAEVLGGKTDKGWGGLVDLGISIGYNRDQQAVVLQIYRDLEHFKSTALPAVFVAGLLVKAGGYVANQAPGALERRGISFYPPMAPGFTSVTPDNFMLGFSSGLTWPPSPLGDMLTYTDQLNQSVILRVTASRLNRRFLHVESGFGVKTIGSVLKPVKNVLSLFRSTIADESCEPELATVSTYGAP